MAKRTMSAEHKAAIARGRYEARIVRDYLDGLRLIKPKRGRKRTVESIGVRMSKIESELGTASALAELQLVQERRDLAVELEAMSDTVDIVALESGFVEVAAGYGSSKGIEYASWREVGVAADVLKLAGITRSAK